MKAAPLLIQWHEDNTPIYAVHFDPYGKGRIATAGGDCTVRLWRIEDQPNDEQKVTYLSTLMKHTRPVNVVRWSPRGDVLASAGDDGFVILWIESEISSTIYGQEKKDDLESWRVQKLCGGGIQKSAEVYDLAWSPDATYFITGSVDNIARIYNASTGSVIRQIAEHGHFVQGVAWDPLNEYLATQSSDRSVHIYTLKDKSGDFSLESHHKISKMDMPAARRRISSCSPAPVDLAPRSASNLASSLTEPSPVALSTPSTPQSLAIPMPMNPPPPNTHSRRSSFGSSPSSIRRSASPAPSLPLPAVMPSSPRFTYGAGLMGRQSYIYFSETLGNFFRRLTFSPDGSLLFTPAGQYKLNNKAGSDELINTVYIHTRAGLNKPPVAYLPGHKKPSIAIRCSPVFYQLRSKSMPTKQIVVDTSSADEEILALPESALGHKTSGSISSSNMDPPPFTGSRPIDEFAYSSASASATGTISSISTTLPAGPPSAFGLPYRMVYAVVTQDAVYVYDTQQAKPICVISNLHFASFTDLSWSVDGLTLIMSSSDGFCSCVKFAPGELGQLYEGKVPATPMVRNTSSSTTTTLSSHATPSINSSTPTTTSVPRQQSIATAFSSMPQPPSPVRSTSAASLTSPFAVPTAPVSTNTSNNYHQHNYQSQSTTSPITSSTAIFINPTPTLQSIPSVAAAHSAPVPSIMPTWMTPPETPTAMNIAAASGRHSTRSASSSVSGLRSDHIDIKFSTEGGADSSEPKVLKRSAHGEAIQKADKKRRIQPTLVSENPEKE